MSFGKVEDDRENHQLHNLGNDLGVNAYRVNVLVNVDEALDGPVALVSGNETEEVFETSFECVLKIDEFVSLRLGPARIFRASRFGLKSHRRLSGIV